MALKYWAKQRAVNDPYRGTLSSYAWVLLAIHYLQTCEPPVLPCLQVPPTELLRDSPCRSLFDETASTPILTRSRPLGLFQALRLDKDVESSHLVATHDGREVFNSIISIPLPYFPQVLLMSLYSTPWIFHDRPGNI